jgi:hypothetical protein
MMSAPVALVADVVVAIRKYLKRDVRVRKGAAAHRFVVNDVPNQAFVDTATNAPRLIL